jgi:outer membrane protein assembly factor BamB
MTMGHGLFAAVVTATAVAAQVPVPVAPRPTVLWHTTARARGVPAILGDTAYALTVDHHVMAVAFSDGQERWRTPTGETGRSTEGSRVVATPHAVVVGDWDVYAFEPGSGRRLWRFDAAAGQGAGVFLGAAHGEVVFSGSPAGRLHAIDVRHGREIWTATVQPDGRTSVFPPVTDGDVVVAGFTTFTAPNTGGVVAVDAATGKERWRFRFPLPADRSLSVNSAGDPVLTGGLAIASGGDGQVWALDARTGAVRWTLPRLAGPFHGVITIANRDFRALAVAGGRLIVGSLTGYVVAYDLDTRQEAWRVEGGWLGSHGFVFAADASHVYVPYVSGILLAIRVADGKVAWSTDDYALGMAWAPASSGDRVVAAGLSGVWAFSVLDPATRGVATAPAPRSLCQLETMP